MALTFNKFLKISHTYVINITRFTLKFSDHRFYRQLTLSRGANRPFDSFLFDCNSTSTQYYVAPKLNENFKVVRVSDKLAKSIKEDCAIFITSVGLSETKEHLSTESTIFSQASSNQGEKLTPECIRIPYLLTRNFLLFTSCPMSITYFYE
jgi:hypothetical protein